MSFKDLLRQLDTLNLPIGHYAIFGSGPMAVRGLRESHDIDLLVSKALFEEFSQKPGWTAKTADCKAEKIVNGDIEMINEWKPGNWDTETLIREAELIDGVPYVRLEEVMKWKAIYGRQKDLDDIALLEEYLKKTSC